MEAILAAVAIATAYSTHHMAVICASTEEVRRVIIKHEEELFWSNQHSSGNIVSLWYNKQTKSYTILQTNKTGETSCVISSGDGSL